MLEIVVQDPGRGVWYRLYHARRTVLWTITILGKKKIEIISDNLIYNGKQK